MNPSAAIEAPTVEALLTKLSESKQFHLSLLYYDLEANLHVYYLYLL